MAGLREEPLLTVFRVAVVLAALGVFLVPAAWATPGLFPAPLDDVYIYFDHARSTARGCFSCWTMDGGFSSGATSPPYSMLLAVGWAVGFRGAALGAFAAAFAVVALVDLLRSLRRITPRPFALALLGPLSVLGVPLLTWSLASGMETALVAAALGRALVAASRTWTAPPDLRARAQARAGAWLALVAWSRPECAPLSACLALAIAHGAGSLGVLGSLARAAGPTAGLLGLWASILRLETGDWVASGALRKVVTYDPYATPLDMAGVFLRNLLRVTTEGVEIALGGTASAGVLLGLGLAAILTRRTRRLGLSLAGGALGALFLVCLNVTAPFQNLRYVAPTLLCLLVLGALGVYALSLRGRALGAAGCVALLGVTAASARALPRQVDHFTRASRNIAEQQVEVGRRLRDLGARRVFLSDAGAIPYVTDTSAIDGLGLGAFGGLPFAKASTHGAPAVLELIERLDPAERPDVLAIYDSWWPGVGARFGHRLFSVSIADNVICGAAEKVVYRADWSLLELRPPKAHDTVDVADLVDEAAHHLTFTRPRGGYVVDAVLLDEAGRLAWDAGRVLAAGQQLTFTAILPGGPRAVDLVVTTDEAADAAVRHGAAHARLEREPAAPGRWVRLRAPLQKVTQGDELTLSPDTGSLRVFAIHLEGPRDL